MGRAAKDERHRSQIARRGLPVLGFRQGQRALRPVGEAGRDARRHAAFAKQVRCLDKHLHRSGVTALSRMQAAQVVDRQRQGAVIVGGLGQLLRLDVVVPRTVEVFTGGRQAAQARVRARTHAFVLCLLHNFLQSPARARGIADVESRFTQGQQRHGQALGLVVSAVQFGALFQVGAGLGVGAGGQQDHAVVVQIAGDGVLVVDGAALAQGLLKAHPRDVKVSRVERVMAPGREAQRLVHLGRTLRRTAAAGRQN